MRRPPATGRRHESAFTQDDRLPAQRFDPVTVRRRSKPVPEDIEVEHVSHGSHLHRIEQRQVQLVGFVMLEESEQPRPHGSQRWAGRGTDTAIPSTGAVT